jgi:hypothetical protein
MDWAGLSISIAYRGCGTRLSTRRAKEAAFAAFPTLQSDLLQLLDVSHQHPFLTQRQKISSSVPTNVHVPSFMRSTRPSKISESHNWLESGRRFVAEESRCGMDATHPRGKRHIVSLAISPHDRFPSDTSLLTLCCVSCTRPYRLEICDKRKKPTMTRFPSKSESDADVHYFARLYR